MGTTLLRTYGESLGSFLFGFQQLCFKAHFLVVVTSVMLPICLDNLVLENISFLICQHNHDIDFGTF